MKWRKGLLESGRGAIILMAMKRVCAAALLILGGCSKQEPPAKPIAEIQGKPIAAAPVTNSPVAAATNAVVSTQAVVVAAAPEVKATNEAPAQVDGYLKVGFDKLSAFNFIMPEEVTATNQPPKDQFPPAIKALDQKPIALMGFMLPLKVEQGLVTEMLLMKDQSMCCFGTTPKINEWVSVKMNEKGVKPIMDQPVTMFGKLHVGEMRENGYLVGIYQMDGVKMEYQ